MADKTTEHVEKDAFLQMQSLWQKYQRPVVIGIAVIVVVVGGWWAYNSMVVKPKEEKAADAIYAAQRYFSVDSSRLVLEGDGVNRGALYVIKNYSGTKEANLAHFYAGISYLKLGDFNNAVKYLKDFSTDAKQVQMVAYGNLADAYSELKKNTEAIEYYEKASAVFEDDEYNSAEYLFRAAALSEMSGKTKEALELYKQIKEKFPKTKGVQMDKYIYRLGGTTEK